MKTLLLRKSLLCLMDLSFSCPSHQQINFGLLIFSVVGFLLPGYLFYHRRQLIKQKKERDQAAADQSTAVLNQSANSPEKLRSDGLDSDEA